MMMMMMMMRLCNYHCITIIRFYNSYLATSQQTHLTWTVPGDLIVRNTGNRSDISPSSRRPRSMLPTLLSTLAPVNARASGVVDTRILARHERAGISYYSTAVDIRVKKLRPSVCTSA